MIANNLSKQKRFEDTVRLLLMNATPSLKIYGTIQSGRLHQTRVNH